MKDLLRQLRSLVHGGPIAAQVRTSKRKKGKRLEFDVLEDRCVPTTYVVTTNLDVVAIDGKVSLREAIMAANTDAPVNEAPAGSAVTPDRILFAPALAGQTITLN